MKLEALVNHINPVIRNIGIQENDWPDKKRKIYDYQLFFCIRGGVRVQLENQTYILRKKDCLLIPPNKKHDLKLLSRDHLILWVHLDLFSSFDQNSLDRRLKSNQLDLFKQELENKNLIRSNIFINDANLKVSFEDESACNISREILNLMQIFEGKEAFYLLESKSILLSILTTYFRQLEKNYDSVYKESLLEILITQYIHENIHRKISVAALANQVGYHPDYLNRLFKKRRGCAIRAYISDYKVITIKKLLLIEEVTLGEISQMTGFSSVNYLSKFFKERVGLTLMQYRSSNLQNST